MDTHIRPVYITHGPESRPDGAAPRCAIEIEDKQAAVVHFLGADAYTNDTVVSLRSVAAREGTHLERFCPNGSTVVSSAFMMTVPSSSTNI